MARRDQEIARKLRVLEHAARTGNIRKTCRYFGVPRSNFYNWKKRYEQEGELGLARKTPVTIAHPRAIAPEIVAKVLHLRHSYHLGPIRIVWYLKRYHDIQISESSVSRILSVAGSIGSQAVSADALFTRIATPNRYRGTMFRWTSPSAA